MAYKQKSEDLSNIARAMSDKSTYSPIFPPTKSTKKPSGYNPTPVKEDDIIYDAGQLDEFTFEITDKPVVYKPLPAVKAQTGYVGRVHGN